MSSSPLLGSRSSSVASSPRTSRDLEKASLPHPMPLSNPPSTRPSRLVLRRTLYALAAVGLVILGLSRFEIAVNFYSINVFPSARRVITTPPVPQAVVRESAPSALLQDSLIEGVKYAATAVGAGFNQQLISYIMLLQYAHEAGRVPILGDFIAASNPNIATDRPLAAHVSFDTVFDLSAFTAATSQAVTTFGALKLPSSEPQTLQCFATNHRTEQQSLKGMTAAQPWGIPWSTAEGVDMDVWDAPESVNRVWATELDIGDLVAFSEDPVRWEMAVSQAESDREAAEARGEVERRSSTALPEQQLACWTDLSWAVDTDTVHNERWGAWPAWEAVGKHLHFAPVLEQLAGEYLRKTLGTRPRDFIAIHARHGDFGCPSRDSSEPASTLGSRSCYRSPSSYLSTVKMIRTRLLREQGIRVSAKSVVIFSDETDERWWDEVADMGWKRVNHGELGTERRFDNWYPTLIDMVLMSQAKGFIGTTDSTYSLLAARRVVDWQQGIVTLEGR